MVILILMLSICAVAPFPSTVGELPFTDEEIGFIKPGLTSRGQVEAALGKPDIVRINSALAVYGRARRVAGLIAGVMGKGAIAPIETLHLLIVRYGANELVEVLDVLRLGTSTSGGADCTADGICVEPRFKPGRTNSWFWDHGGSVLAKAMVFDKQESDAAIKTFEIQDDACAMYVYHNERLLGNRDILVYRNAPHTAPVIMNEDGFLHWKSEPGPVVVSASVIRQQESDSIPVKGEMQVLEFSCETGKQYFIDIDLREGWFKFVLEIALDDIETGIAAVRNRRLMLDLLGPE